MTITILTLFPEIISSYLSSSIIGKAHKKQLVSTHIVNMRDFATDPHKSVDDKPFGGGVGMILRIDILDKAITFAINQYAASHKKPYSQKVLLMDPVGSIFTQSKARSYTGVDHLILLCGHYEGFDARIDHFIDEKVSIGKYVLTGGELPALVILDAIVRLLPNVLQKQATSNESHSGQQLQEAPQYTRPAQYHGFSVPEILLSGNHAEIASWRDAHSIKKNPKKK